MNAKAKPCHTIGILEFFFLVSVVLLSRVCVCVYIGAMHITVALTKGAKSKPSFCFFFKFFSYFLRIGSCTLAFNSIDKISSFDTKRCAIFNLFFEHKIYNPFLNFRLSCVSDQQDISHLAYPCGMFNQKTKTILKPVQVETLVTIPIYHNRSLFYLEPFH